AERRAFLFTQQSFTGAIGAGYLLLAGDRFLPFGEGLGIKVGTLCFQFRRKAVHVTLVIVTRNQLILAAGEKFHEMVEELTRLGQATITIELQSREVAAQENPMIDLIEHAAFEVSIFQEGVAESVKGFQRDVFAALANAADDA